MIKISFWKYWCTKVIICSWTPLTFRIHVMENSANIKHYWGPALINFTWPTGSIGPTFLTLPKRITFSFSMHSILISFKDTNFHQKLWDVSKPFCRTPMIYMPFVKSKMVLKFTMLIWIHLILIWKGLFSNTQVNKSKINHWSTSMWDHPR